MSVTVRLEDDVLDQSVLEDGEHDVVLQGEGALLAAVSGTRTGRMGDIVATIQQRGSGHPATGGARHGATVAQRARRGPAAT